MTETLRREINGVPYLFTRNRWGWGVTCLDGPAARFHRSYQVVVDGQGTPKSCSCPDSIRRGSWCKHLREADAIRRETDPEHRKQLAETAARCGL